MIRALCLALAFIIAPFIVRADPAFTRLYDLIEMDAYLDVTIEEGLRGVDELSVSISGRLADAALHTQMARIYDKDRMRETVMTKLQNGLSAQDISAALLFFESPVGARITDLEVAARRAMMDPAIEDAARTAWFEAEEERPWLTARINEVIDVSDLIDRNVSGTLNSNLRFFQGLADGGGLDMSQDEMLNDVWSQEDGTRAETAAWLGGYLHLAYDPLSESDLETYIAFWGTDVGKSLNAAIFTAFNTMFDDISYASGRVLAMAAKVQDL